MKEEKQALMVTVHCLTYNQERYIRQCLEGFVKQLTNFRFEAIVHDDASTDGTADIIREYAEKYPDIIKPIFETENQYSKRDGSLRRIMDEHTHGKYVAVCEGDDYWIDPNKLQKQFDFMESNPDCSMCFHAHMNYYPSKEKFVDVFYKPAQKFLYPKDVITIDDGIIGTNTVFYRYEYLLNEGRPEFWRKCPVGDFPMRLFFTSKGTIGYIDEIMSVYRRESIGGWTSRKTTFLSRTKRHRKTISTYRLYDKYTKKKYHSLVVGEINKMIRIIVKDAVVTLARTLHIKRF